MATPYVPDEEPVEEPTYMTETGASLPNPDAEEHYAIDAGAATRRRCPGPHPASPPCLRATLGARRMTSQFVVVPVADQPPPDRRQLGSRTQRRRARRVGVEAGRPMTRRLVVHKARLRCSKISSATVARAASMATSATRRCNR